MVYNSIEDKRNCYGIEKISVSDEAFGKIMSLEPDVIDNVLDKVIIGQRDGNSPIDISSEVVEQAIKNQLKNIKCGFN
ncbi:MAG: hypothetical protein IKA02_05020 [Clostridia bacterium]|nr:hypothetical protein [Clostridia bacterium]